MNKGEEHAIECDTKWDAQKETNTRHEDQFKELFTRINQLEVRLAGMAAVGGVIGSIIGKLF